MYRIKKKITLNDTSDLMEIEAPLVAKNAQPGHFVILRVDEDGERIPLTIAGVEGDAVTIIYQKLGYSTEKLGKKEEGDYVEDFAGPLGNPAHIRHKDHVVGVAGGVGSAPLLPQMRAYKENGSKVTIILGARNKDQLILKSAYESFADEVLITTDDGSLGKKGFVTDALLEVLKEENADHVVAIGPVIMMKHTAAMAKDHGLSVDVSLNPIMIDGTGMCGNCRVTIGGKTYFGCIDGPDFSGEEVDYDELIARQSYYKDQEHECYLKLGKDE